MLADSETGADDEATDDGDEDVAASSQDLVGRRDANRRLLRPFMGLELGYLGSDAFESTGSGARVAAGLRQHLVPRFGWELALGGGFYAASTPASFWSGSGSAVLGPFGRFVARGGLTIGYLDVETTPLPTAPDEPTPIPGFVFGPRLDAGLFLGDTDELYLGGRFDFLTDRYPVGERNLITGFHLELSVALGSVRRQGRSKSERPGSFED